MLTCDCCPAAIIQYQSAFSFQEVILRWNKNGTWHGGCSCIVNNCTNMGSCWAWLSNVPDLTVEWRRACSIIILYVLRVLRVCHCDIPYLLQCETHLSFEFLFIRRMYTTHRRLLEGGQPRLSYFVMASLLTHLKFKRGHISPMEKCYNS